MTATTVPSVTVPRVTLPSVTMPTAPSATTSAAPLPHGGPVFDPPAPRGARGAGRHWRDLTERVKGAGQYPTRAEAERVTRIVLSALGGHVTGDERVDLARALPEEAARVIASQIPVTHPLTAAEFVEAVAARIEGSTPATARWDVSSVLSVLADTIDTDLLTRILAQLPAGYALLFGRAELSPAP